MSLDEAAATAAAAVVDGGKRLLLFDAGELLFGTPVVVIVGSELAHAIASSGFVADELLFTDIALGLTNRSPDADSFEIESLRGGSRSFTLSSILASSKEIFFFSPSDWLPRTCFTFFL